MFSFRSPRFKRVVVALCATSMLCASVPTAAFADTQSDLAAARAQLEEIGRKAASVNRELSELTAAYEQTSGEIAQKEDELSSRQSELSTYISSEYKIGPTSLAQLITDSESFADIIANMFYMNKVADTQSDIIGEVKTIKNELTAKQAEQEKTIASTQAKVDELNNQRSSASALVDSLDAQLQEELRAEAEANAALQAGLDAGEGDEVVDPTPAPPANDNADGNNSNAGGSGNGGTGGGNDNTNTGGGNQGGSSVTPPPSVDGNAVVQRAYSKLGWPYVYGAVGPDAFDCSGFVSYCLTGSYVRLGTTYTFMGWPQVSNPQPGDIVTSSYHCGVYIGNGQMIHAAQPGVGVIVGPVQSDMIYVRY